MSLSHFTARPALYPVYDVKTIKAWEGYWFSHSTSDGLMQQVAYVMAEQVSDWLSYQAVNHPSVVVACGAGNNGGDGYWVGYYLAKMGFDVRVFVAQSPVSPECQRAHTEVMTTLKHCDGVAGADVVIDALFGIGLCRVLDEGWCVLIDEMNKRPLKIALDVPSGLSADTGMPMPVAFRADLTLCAIGLKVGLLTGQGRGFAGRIIPINLLPPDERCRPVAYLDTLKFDPPIRQNHAHKGNFGHVFIIGGHPQMGGAVMMAGEGAMAVGAGKVSVICHQSHHSAILARSPNLMVADIDGWQMTALDTADVIAFGMGLGRDEWGREQFLRLMRWLNSTKRHLPIILDADALFWLSRYPQMLPKGVICTPHASEAGRLLGVSVCEVEQDRVRAIDELRSNYGADWVLKGSGSLSLEGERLSICAYGNPKMATAGMGDVLSGVIAGLKAQGVSLSDCVKVHAKAGDKLAKRGQVMAHEMVGALKSLGALPITTPSGQHQS